MAGSQAGGHEQPELVRGEFPIGLFGAGAVWGLALLTRRGLIVGFGAALTVE